MPKSDDPMELDGEGEDSIGDLFSDDSSFYGDEDVKEAYEDRAKDFDVEVWWQTEHFALQKLAAENFANPPTKPSVTSLLNPNKDDPHNIFEGQESAKQLNESASVFVSRLPPETTLISQRHIGPWLWVSNPFARRSRGEDSKGFVEDGLELLIRHKAKRAELERLGKTKGAVTRMLKSEREKLEKDLVSIAKDYNMTSGKWMLFPMPKDVNDVWLKVVNATATGELGTSAKVATDNGEDDKGVRLICIYNDDFTDTAEVKRILLKLMELRLVSKNDTRATPYKCDAWTHLGIYKQNDYGLDATMYRSRDILQETEKR